MKRYGVTRRGAEVLAFIASYNDENGFSPSYDEIKDVLGLKAKSGVHRIVHMLVDRGRLKIDNGKARSLIVIGETDDSDAYIRRLESEVRNLRNELQEVRASKLPPRLQVASRG